jgi:branched-chain amino acid transport system ATP-binding protein
MRPGPVPAAMSRQDALVVTDLSVDYGYGPVVDGMSLDVNRGEVVAVVGANGAGKTSTLRGIAGFVHSTGSVVYGADLSSLAPFRRVRHGIALVPDNRGLFAPLNVRDHLWLACEGRSRPDSDVLEGVVDLFPVLGKRMRQQAGSMSGGEQQMLTMAMALLAKPDFLLIDELSTGLAPILVNRLFESVQRIARERNIGVVLVEQFVAEVLGIADRAIVMSRGRSALTGQAQDLAARMTDVAAAYFGTDPTTAGAS